MREVKDTELLLLVDHNVVGQKLEAIRDSGSEICVFRKDLFLDKFMTEFYYNINL